MTTTEADGRRFAAVPAIAAAAGIAILIGLGVWQLQRLHWKEGILAQIAALQSAPPAPLAPLLERAAKGADIDYHRVEAACPELEHTRVLRLYAVGDSGAGYRVITACPIASGPFRSILVDRGFITPDVNVASMPARPMPIDQPIVGILRKGDRPNFVTPPNQPAQNLWYWRDISTMARTLGASDPAPSFLMLESPAPPSGGPTPQALPSDIPNNHLQYAITWFGLAAALAGVYLASLWTKGRLT
jgi:surfeit locus 1 family protein